MKLVSIIGDIRKNFNRNISNWEILAWIAVYIHHEFYQKMTTKSIRPHNFRRILNKNYDTVHDK